jgi:hypothetical protein
MSFFSRASSVESLLAGNAVDGDVVRFNGATWEAAKGGQLVLLDTQTASNSSSLEFTTALDGTYDHYILELTDVVMAADNRNLFVQVTQDGGSSWKTGAADYKWTATGSGTGGFTNSDMSDSEAQVSGVFFGNVSGESVNAKLDIFSPDNGSLKKHIQFEISGFDYASGDIIRQAGVGAYIGNNNAIDGLRIIPSAGNITSGVGRLYGVRT